MEDIVLNTFPGNDIEALAMLYVRNQDLTGMTPEQLIEMYDSTVDAMTNARKAREYANSDWL